MPRFSLFAQGICVLAAMAAQNAAAADEATIERGRYLAVEVAQCQMCHTPKLPDGSYDKEKWMKGSVLNIQPIEPIKGWHKTAPDITPSGRLWGRWTEQGLLKYMETGLTPKGTQADAPMPTYKLTTKDAQALVEYLKTLK